MTYIVIAMIAAIFGTIAGFFIGVAAEGMRAADILAISDDQYRRRRFDTGTRGARI